MPPERDLGVVELLVRVEPQLLEALGGFVQSVSDRGDVRERWPAPQRESRVQLLGSLGGRQSARLMEEPLEAARVDGLGVDGEGVAGIAGDDRVGPEQPAELRDVALERGGCGARRVLAPEGMDQAVGRDESSWTGRQERQRGALFRASQPDRGCLSFRCYWAEQADLET